MKRTLFIALASVAFSSAAIAQSQFFVAGDFQTPAAWVPNVDLMNDLGNDHYQLSFSGVSAGIHEMKVTDGTWDTTFPPSNKRIVVGGDGNVTIDFFNKATFGDGWEEIGPRIGFTSTATMAWDIIGGADFLSNWGTGVQLTDMGSGLFQTTFTPTATGVVAFKFRQAGVWGGHEFGFGGGADGDLSYDFQNLNETTVSFDTQNGRYKFESVPEPASMTVLGIAALAALRRRKK